MDDQTLISTPNAQPAPIDQEGITPGQQSGEGQTPLEGQQPGEGQAPLEDQQSGEPSPNPNEPEWFQKRIDELTRDKYEERRQRERLQQMLDRQEAMLARFQEQGNAPAAPAAPPGPPQPGDYVGGQFDPKYMQDMLTFTREEARREAIETVKAEQQAYTQRMALEEQQRRMAVSEAAARAKYGDYDQAITAITNDPMLAQNPVIRQAVLESENGPDIAYLLSKNLDIAYSLTQMSPIAAGMKLAELVNRAPRHSANAPVPPRPISGVTGSVTGKKPLAEMSTAEYIAARNAEEDSRRQARMKR